MDARGRVIDKNNPRGLPRFEDRDGDGDIYDDAYLTDTRLDPLRAAGRRLVARSLFSRHPGQTRSGRWRYRRAVYYQSVEAIAALKFLGNLADTDADFRLEPCVLGGLCDGRTSAVEPAVVEGSPPMPMEVRSWLIGVNDSGPARAPALSTYPAPGAVDVYRDAVIKVTFSEPIVGLDPTALTLRDNRGALVPATVDQVGDGTLGALSTPGVSEAERDLPRADARRGLRTRRWLRADPGGLAVHDAAENSPGAATHAFPSATRVNRTTGMTVARQRLLPSTSSPAEPPSGRERRQSNRR